jgi:regulator of RNase E activity RraA
VFADFDGVVVIPKEVDSVVFKKARKKVSNENSSRKELLEGKSLREVYQKYKAL